MALAGLAWAAASAACAQAGQTVRIAFIDPLSGPLADIGRNSLRSWSFVARRQPASANPAGVRFVVAPFDNKGSPQESLNALKAAIDQGFRYVAQGHGSGIALVLGDAIARHNARHPDRPVLYLNYAANDPTLTGERCGYWHFRIDADTTMKVQALVDFIATRPQWKRLFLLNQDYAHGQQVARVFKERVAERLPGVEIVGEVLHPPFALADFKAQAEQVRAAGADAIVTGNWGEDLNRLIASLIDARLHLPLLTYYGNLAGAPTALARGGGALPAYQVGVQHGNPEGELGRLAADFRRHYREDYVVFASFTGIRLLGEAMARARSTDTRRVAEALEGLSIPVPGGRATLRADDHQLLQDLFVSRWAPVDARHAVGAEGTAYAFVPEYQAPVDAVATPSRCAMPRP